MKIRNHPLQSDSLSTLARQKKFQRKSLSKQSRSFSSQSDSKSLSKFFVRNLQMQQKPLKIDEILKKNIEGSQNWSPPRRQSTPAKTQAQKRLLLSKQEYISLQSKQIDSCKQQITKYKNYTHKQTEKINKYTEQNKKLKEQVSILKHQIQQKQQKIKQLNQTLHQKQTMLEYCKKQQPSLQKVKTNIFQTKMCQFQRQKEQLNNKILQLQKTIQDLKSNSKIYCGSSPISVKESFVNSNILDKSMLSQDEYAHKMQKELYKAKQQIKRLQIAESCTKRKFFKQLQAYRQKRDKQYQELKKKFTQFLGKYKLAMKKFSTFQLKSIITKQDKTTLQLPNSLQSQISLTLSQDQQHK